MNYRALFVAAVAALFGFAAQAVEWSGEVAPESDVSEPITLNGEVAVNVASGTTITLSGMISDGASAGKIILKGGGTLALAAANAFTGGVQIDEGVMVVGHAGALGSGPVGIAGSTTGDCQLRIDTTLVGAAQTISNPIMLQGASANNHPAIFFVLPTSGTTAWTVTFTGGIKAEGNLYLGDTHGGCTGSENSGKDWAGKKWVVFDCAIDVGNCWLQYGDKTGDWQGPNGDVYFQGAVTAGTYCVSGYTGHRYGSAGSVHFSSSENAIGDFKCNYNHVYLDVADALGDARVNITDAYGSSRSYIYLKADQHARSLTSCKYKSSDTVVIRGLSPSTLTLDGAAADSKTSYINLKDLLSLVVDARDDDFVQTLSSTTNTMTGTIAVKRGMLKLVNDTKFASVSGITVSGGVLDAAGLGEDGFASVETLTLGSAGRIDMGGRTLVVDTLTIDGAMLLYADHTTHPDQIAEGTVLRARKVPSGMSYTTVDTTAMGDWEIDIPAKSTNIVTVMQTGSGRIIKTGLGELLLTTTNTFTGGIQIDAGVVVVGHAGALGNGPVDIAGSTTADCQLRIDTTLVQDTQTISNPITLQGASAATHPAIFFVLPTTKATGTPWTVTFTGGITANGDFYLGDSHGGCTGSDNSGKDWCGTTWVVFDCPVNAAGYQLQYGDKPTNNTNWQGPNGDVYFNGAVTAKTFSVYGYTGTAYGSAGSIYFASSENAIDDISAGYNFVYLTAPEALGDARVNITRSTGSARSIISLSADQHVRSLTSVAFKNTKTVAFNATSASTLTFDGAEADGGKTAVVGFKGALSIVVDAREDGFVQTFKDRGDDDNTMTGSITVKRGTLKLIGNMTFANASAVEVSGGVLEVSTTAEGCFASAATLSVSNGATFKVASGVGNLFANEDLSWYLESGATLEFADPTTVAVHDLFVDGQYCPDKGSGYTHADFDVIPENLTITVTGKGQLTDADWVGGGADRLATTMENWQVNGATPSGLDLSNGLTTVTLKSGAGMTFKDGMWVKSILSDIPLPDEVAEPVTPFEIAPENAGDTLYLSEGFSSDKKMQIVLGGHIAAAEGADPNQKFYYSVKPAAVDGIIRFSPPAYNGSSAALVLNGVTMDIPLEVEQSGNKMTMFALSNTVNEINAPMKFVFYSSGLGAEENSVIRFHGGVSFPACYNLCGPGEIVIDTKPATFSDGAVLDYNAHLTLGASTNLVTGNKNREGMYIHNATLELTCDNAFRNDTQLLIAKPNVNSVIDLHTTSQQVGRVNFASAAGNTSAQVTGGYLSMIELTAKVRSGAVGTYVMPLYCSTRVTGGVGFHMYDQDGGTNVFTLAGRDFESCGDLMVSAGMMELAADATWLHGTNFTAKGEGTLKFAAADQVNSYHAVLHLADNGKIYIPEGVTLSFAEAFVREGADETAVEHGKYTGSEGALADRIIGGGTLRIGKRGMMLMIQ